MTGNPKLYSLKADRRDSYVHVRVTPAESDEAAPYSYLEGAARHFVRHDCSCMLIENGLSESLAVWDAVAIAPRLARHVDGCIKIAVVETEAERSGQDELKVHLSGDNVMTVRVFETVADAEAWFDEEG